MLKKLNELFDVFNREIKEKATKEEVLNLKANYVGKKGTIVGVLKSLRDASPEEKRQIGPRANEIKSLIQNLVQNRIDELKLCDINSRLAKNKIDITLRDSIKFSDTKHAGFHPVTTIRMEIEDIFLSMGFEVLDGPHVEDEYHNFDALNTPADHPARDMQDTFWFHDPHSDESEKYLLRTHTSAVQIRGMKERKPPFRFIAPGKVFRCERTDASHEAVFHQLEGMLVGKNISVANLIYFMKITLREILKKDVDVRLRPGFFPFVEPGFELDIKCLICNGKGCNVCKYSGWVELLPCGMIHPNVLRAGDIDPKVWNGFAFGLGLDRLVMMRYGIDDIRHIHGADLRFISQFKNY